MNDSNGGAMSVAQVPGESDRSLFPEDDDQRRVNLLRSMLLQRFVVPPFTILDTRQGYWRERRAQWRAVGVAPEEGRSQDLMKGGGLYAGQTEWVGQRTAVAGSSSQFDPVLCEAMYRWFCPPGGTILDPFAGEATKGVVAAALGYQYLGVELRQEQVEANRAQAERLGLTKPRPQWVCADATTLDTALPSQVQADFIWTSPPYYDLEVYSNLAEDGSALPTYEEFMEFYAIVFAAALRRLRPNRFLAVKIGDVRDPQGAYRGFLRDNLAVFTERLGLALYNEAVLITPFGTAPVRATRSMRNRKLVRCHQNVLVFWKGAVRDIKKHFIPLDFADEPGAVEVADSGEEDSGADH